MIGEQKATVVIPTWRRPTMLRGAVGSALNQECLGEVIVVDDTPISDPMVDDNRAVVSLFNDQRLKYMPNTRASGANGARNTGILNAAYSLITFLDDDDLLLPGGLKHYVGEFQEGVYMVQGSILQVDLAYGRRRIQRCPNRWISYEDALLARGCPYGAGMMRKELFNTIGMYDEALCSYQDYDLWTRAARYSAIKSFKEIVLQVGMHHGTRTSVDMGRRRKGLEQIIEKWGREIENHGSLPCFVKSEEAKMYTSNGQAILAGPLRRRHHAIWCFYRALLRDPKNYTRSRLFWFVISLIGYTAAKCIVSASSKQEEIGV